MKKHLTLLLSLLIVLLLTACKSSDYKEAMNLFESGDYLAALAKFEVLGDYENSTEMVDECKYQDAMDTLESGDYSGALAKFEVLVDYKNSTEMVDACKYQYAVTQSARLHALLDYNLTFYDITFTEVTVNKANESYVTVCGEVIFADKNENKYIGSYKVVLIRQSSEDTPYKVGTWELDRLKPLATDQNIDYIEALKKYIIENGYYDAEGDQSYLEVQKAANMYFYLFAGKDGISFWSFTKHETYSYLFYHSYECSFDNAGKAEFVYKTGEHDLLYGEYDLFGDHSSVEATGTIDYTGNVLTFYKCDLVNLEKEYARELVKDSHLDVIDFIEEILREAQIGVLSFEDLFSI